MLKKVMFCFVSFFIGMYAFSQNTAVEIRGVKITSYGNGYYVMELDGVGQCIPLQLIELPTPGWVRVVCSDIVKDIVADNVGKAVGDVVKFYIDTHTGSGTPLAKIIKKYAPSIAEAVAKWATRLGHEKLCKHLNEPSYEVVCKPFAISSPY